MKNRDRYQNKALENLINSKMTNVKEKVKISSSTSYATRNLPALIGDHMNMYFEETHQVAQALINEVNATLQFKTTVNETLQSNNQSLKKSLEQNNDLAAAQTKEALLAEQAKNCKPAHRYRRLIIGIAIAVICLFEGILGIPVFEKWGLSLIAAVGVAFLFACVLAIFTHMVPRIIRYGKTVWQRRLIAFGLLVLTTILFKYMADERVLYIMSTTNSSPVSPYPFVITSTLLLVIAVAISHFYMPTTEELQKIKEYKEVNKELNKSRNEISNIKKKSQINETEKDEFVNLSGSLLVYGDSLEQMIINYAYEC